MRKVNNISIVWVVSAARPSLVTEQNEWCSTWDPGSDSSFLSVTDDTLASSTGIKNHWVELGCYLHFSSR